MKVLLENHTPFMLAHGGAQVQIEQTKAALEKVGVSVEPLRWWDETQSGDVLHHFARIPIYIQRLARQKGMKGVMSAFMGGLGARPAWKRFLQKMALRAIRPVAPRRFRDLFGWDSYRLLDAIIALTPHEATLLTRVHNAPPSRVHVIPNGVEDALLNSRPAPRGRWLVCTATITELKGVLKLAQMAVQAKPQSGLSASLTRTRTTTLSVSWHTRANTPSWCATRARFTTGAGVPALVYESIA